MGRPPSIDYKDVATVADALKSKGEKTGNREVRILLGKGGGAEIAKHMRTWRSRQHDSNLISDEVLDSSVTYAISSYIANKIKEATAAHLVQVEELESEADMLIAECESQSEALEAQINDFNALQKRYDEMIGKMQLLEAHASETVEALTAERQAAEAARVALGKAEVRLEAIPKIETELKDVRTELKETEALAANYKEAAAVANAKYEKELNPHKAD